MMKIFLALLLLTMPAFADTKLSALSNNSSPTGTDLTYDVASGTSYNVTLAQVKSYVTSANVGIGTSFSSNYLDVASSEAVGLNYAGYFNAPPNGLIVQGNVGIGSSNPGDNLDVVGTARVSGHVTLEGVTSTGASGTGNLVFGTSPTLVTPALGTPSALVGTNISGTASSLTSGITNALKSATTTVNVSSATAPSSGQVLTATSGTAATWQTVSGSGSGTVGIGTTTRIPVYQGTSTVGSPYNNVMDSNGNVGIGLSNPTQLLDINGNARLSGSFPVLIVGDANNNSVNVQGIDVGLNGVAQINTSGVIQGTNLDASTGLVWSFGGSADKLALGSNLTEYIGDTNDLGGDIFFTTSSSKRMTIANAGNVGIGSISPGDLLDVAGTARMTAFNMPTSVTNNYVLTTDASGNGTWKASAGGGSGISTITDGVNTVTGATQLTVTGGTVGGTTPNATLSVTGSSQWATQNTTDVSLAGGNVGIGTTLTTTSALTVMNGNVGIGTWIPSALFTVGTGASKATISNLGAVTANGLILNSTLTGNGNNANFTSGLISLTSGSFDISGAGNVGIGTNLTNQTLSIAGVIGYKPNAPTITSCGTTPSGSVVGNDAQGTITVGGTATGCTLAFKGTYAKSPHCNITNQSMSISNAMTYTESTAGFVVSQAVGLSSDLLDYHCTFDN